MGHGELMEEDDIVIRVGNSLYRERRTNKGGRVVSLRSL
jgi:6-phosphogluconate dehydrogenase (decarboxylating)